jgi:hypothetical protein
MENRLIEVGSHDQNNLDRCANPIGYYYSAMIDSAWPMQ